MIDSTCVTLFVRDLEAACTTWAALPGAEESFYIEGRWAEYLFPGQLRVALRQSDEELTTLGYHADVTAMQQQHPDGVLEEDPSGVRLLWCKTPDGLPFYFWEETKTA